MSSIDIFFESHLGFRLLHSVRLWAGPTWLRVEAEEARIGARGRYRRLPVRQPLDAISEYFGETVGFYFAFLEFYTISLVFPSAAGIVLFCFQVYSRRIDHWLLPFYSLFLGVWSMGFLVRWRRRRVELAYRWGVMDHEDEEIERVEFQGEYRISPGTFVCGVLLST